MPLPITILPGDKRMEYTAGALSKKGGTVCSSWSDIPDSGYVICGIPFTRDGRTLNTSISAPLSIQRFLGMLNASHILVGGNLPDHVVSYCRHHNIRTYDIMTSASFVSQNARLTAEGVLIPLLSHTSFSICDCRALLVGYGHCGKEIADILRLFTNELYIYDTNPSAIKAAEADHYKTVSERELCDSTHKVHKINAILVTSPVNPFPQHVWGSFPDGCAILNIASFSLKLPPPLSEHVIPCPGIPGNYAPKTAGNIIAKEICNHFKL